jgi:inhibitor of cysteine peptidase
MKITPKNIMLFAFLGYMSISAASAAIKNDSDNVCTSGYFSLETGDYSKEPEKKCLPETSGKFTVNDGDRFSINLPGNSSTGASWGLRSMPDTLMLMDVYYRRATRCDKELLAGCGGIATYIFKVVDKGDKGNIRFQYGRPWEKDIWNEKDVEIIVK